ncbi:MAG: hypothetical protein QNK04_21495 [Myxococcota bacterium]|nr:hypothetical protein [Myxococcota bacterium]
MTRTAVHILLALGAAALFSGGLLRHLSHPLFWADEAETAMFARHVLEYGYPKVHSARNVVYQFGPTIAAGVKESTDAYIGTTWGHFYWAAPALLWARGSDDLYARTLRVRLPFALAGAAGVGLWLWALLPAVSPGRRWLFAAAFLLLSALSVSLVLHLREVRYYPLVVLLSGALAREHLRYTAHGQSGFPRWAASLPILLLLLFHTFFQAFFAVAGLLGLERLYAVLRGRTPWRDLTPFVGAALLVAPWLVYFEIFQTARAFAASFGFGVGGYLENLVTAGAALLRNEFLLPALLARGAVSWLGVQGAGPWVAGRLLGFAAGFAALGCLNPLPFERYFVPLSPVLTGAFLLDAFALLEALPARFAPAQRRRVTAAALVALVVVTGLCRWPLAGDLRGRWAELRDPYRGPLDHVIPYLEERYPHPERLVIATNYEEYAFMYYLGSHVIVGLALNNIRRDRELEPDVVVPRRRWPKSLAELRPFLARGEWEEVTFPVPDLHHNNVPWLSRASFAPAPHRFRSPITDARDERVVVYLRRDGAAESGS